VNFNHFDASEDSDALAAFNGVTRLFPLPNVVLFPGVLLPLHIFEPRYRQMVSDALGSDMLITMVLSNVSAGQEEECPPIVDVGCIGRIVHHEPLPDGRSNLILRGLQRVRIDSEIASDRMYRMARVTDLKETCSQKGRSESVENVFKALSEILTLVGRASDADKLSIARDLPAARLCDLAAHCLSIDIFAKQSLLAELDVDRRVESLLAWMDALRKTLQKRQITSGQPPAFSQN
jgi:uncharacterized protein